jgi:lipoprotein-anchoring transpeptidase ErfK/SrfK
MAFEDQHQLPTDGTAGPQVWAALLQAAAAGQTDTYGHYDFVEVSTSVPEHVDVWRDGALVYRSAANSGIEAAPTELGTWPVYARYVSTTMSGTNPDGSHYSDPDIPWVSYFHGGDALHGFIRSSYGTPQSLGCVEMPPANAAVVYPYTPLGTLVTVA